MYQLIISQGQRLKLKSVNTQYTRRRGANIINNNVSLGLRFHRYKYH